MTNALYEDVTKTIIVQLEAGIVPWAKPWGEVGCTMPCNAVSKRRYSGVNVLILWTAAIAGGYVSPHWLTYKQAQDLGGNVRKGERGTTVVMKGTFVSEAEKARVDISGDDARAIPFLKKFSVFNVAQCDGLPPMPEATALTECEKHVAAEALMIATGADIRIGSEKACYIPALDCVMIPPQAAFHDSINYYRTAFHELSHWTGHSSRLGRDFSGRFGNTKYAREELVAEIGAAFLCASLGIEPTVRHADYIGSWLAVLKEDSRAIFQAASLASKAADYILASDVACDDRMAA